MLFRCHHYHTLDIFLLRVFFHFFAILRLRRRYFIFCHAEEDAAVRRYAAFLRRFASFLFLRPIML